MGWKTAPGWPGRPRESTASRGALGRSSASRCARRACQSGRSFTLASMPFQPTRRLQHRPAKRLPPTGPAARQHAKVSSGGRLDAPAQQARALIGLAQRDLAQQGADVEAIPDRPLLQPLEQRGCDGGLASWRRSSGCTRPGPAGAPRGRFARLAANTSVAARGNSSASFCVGCKPAPVVPGRGDSPGIPRPWRARDRRSSLRPAASVTCCHSWRLKTLVNFVSPTPSSPSAETFGFSG